MISVLFVIAFSILHCDSSSEKKGETIQVEKKYLNLSPEVHYVGINTCRQCHYEIYESFMQTGMGKSFDKATKQKSSAKFDAHHVVYDKFSDFYYHPFWNGDPDDSIGAGTMRIMEFRLEGKDTVHKRIENVSYIVGSGHHTNSHIQNSNGYLNQLPITFFTQKGKWDFAPGFENGANSRFSRKIGLECMSCHNSLPKFVMGSENKYEEVPSGISCERCHGPGEIHVQEKKSGHLVDTSKYIDYTIVNPAKLPIDLQFDVCQRCHLQGNAVLKEGKSFYDFRPGMKLSDVMTVFLPRYENDEQNFIMASHADRLKMSKCFIQSEKSKVKRQKEENILKPYKNALTCVTCHNPHVNIQTVGSEVFNAVCKNCHTAPLSPLSHGRGNGGEANCVSCHMPKSSSIDIPHVTITDHFIRKIRRSPIDSSESPFGPMKKQEVDEVKKFIGLVAINEKNPSAKVMAEAYMNQFEKFSNSRALLDSSQKYLSDKSVEEIKNNFFLLIRLNFLKDAFGKIIFYADKIGKEKLLGEILIHQSYDNNDAWTCYRIGEAYDKAHPSVRSPSDQPDSPIRPLSDSETETRRNGERVKGRRGEREKEAGGAYSFYKKAVELAPYNYEFKNKYGSILFRLGKTEDAKNIFQEIVKENPKYAPAFCNLGYCYSAKDATKALELYDKAIALDPDYVLALVNKINLLQSLKRNSEAKILIERVKKLKNKV